MDTTNRMSRRSVIASALSTAALSGCGVAIPGESIELRYRLNIQIFAGGKIREGSGVMRSVIGSDYGRAWAEAIPIDMGGGEFLFAVLGALAGSGGTHRFWPQYWGTFESLYPPNQSSERTFDVWLRSHPLKGETDAAPVCRPQLVRYKDLQDPTTAQFIEWPGEQYRNNHPDWGRTLAEAYGRDVHIARTTLQLVSEPVTRRIEKVLPLVGRLEGADGSGYTIPAGPVEKFSSYVIYRNFKMKGDYSS